MIIVTDGGVCDYVTDGGVCDYVTDGGGCDDDVTDGGGCDDDSDRWWWYQVLRSSKFFVPMLGGALIFL